MQWLSILHSARWMALVAAFSLLTVAGCSSQPTGATGEPMGRPVGDQEVTSPLPGESPTQEVAGISRVAPTGTPLPAVEPVATSTAGPIGRPEGSSTPSPTPVGPTQVPGSFPFVELDEYTVRPGESATLYGSGFAAGERIRVYLASSPRDTLAEARADDQGEFTVPDLEVPAAESGDRTLVVEGQSSRLRVERTVSTVSYAPWVRLDRYAVDPGESIGFSGFDFAPGERVLVYLDGERDSALAELMANERGEVGSQSLMTPESLDVGSHSLTFAGQTTGSEMDVGFEVLAYTPIIGLTSYAGRPGALVAFDGQGFAPNETIRVHAGEGESRREVAVFQADSGGEFAGAGEFRVPADASPGEISLTVEGAQSRVPVSQSFKVDAVEPWAGLSSYVGGAGDRVDVRVEGFGANETVTVYLDGGRQGVASGETDVLGAAQMGPVVVPADAGEGVTFLVRGDRSGAESRVEFTVIR